MDFTINKYKKLLYELRLIDVPFITFSDYIHLKDSLNQFIILRHDVDSLPKNSLLFAKIQAELGIRGTFYFRITTNSWDPLIIEEISKMGHEVGYHYEDLSFLWEHLRRNASIKGSQDINIEKLVDKKGIELFQENLIKMKQLVPVSTICMHGSPMSRWDSRLLWKYYDYRDFDIIGEPYFDINFDKILYLTDTGRRWNGSGVSVRDKAYTGQGSSLAKALEDRAGQIGVKQRFRASERAQDTSMRSEDIASPERRREDPFKDWMVKPVEGSLMNMTQKAIDFQKQYNFHSTGDIIKALDENRFPEKAMITFHPQRWTDKTFPWLKELIFQNAKNVVKFYLVKSS